MPLAQAMDGENLLAQATGGWGPLVWATGGQASLGELREAGRLRATQCLLCELHVAGTHYSSHLRNQKEAWPAPHRGLGIGSTCNPSHLRGRQKHRAPQPTTTCFRSPQQWRLASPVGLNLLLGSLCYSIPLLSLWRTTPLPMVHCSLAPRAIPSPLPGLTSGA